MRGAFTLKLDSGSDCAETPRVLRPMVISATPASTRLTRAPRRRANISISTMTTMRTSRGFHRNASPSESATRSSTCQYLNSEERFVESTQELIIEQIGDQVVDVPVPQLGRALRGEYTGTHHRANRRPGRRCASTSIGKSASWRVHRNSSSSKSATRSSMCQCLKLCRNPAPAAVIEYVAPASAVTDTAPPPVIEYVAPVLAVTCATPTLQ